jgi:pimeloyl-ACP methyl ester carboxylesterase
MLLAFGDDGPGPVVVLLHGFPLDRSMWSAQVGKIGSLYRLITPDLRGHGATAAPDGIYTIDAMADDVIETLDGLQLRQPVVLGGLSMGGYIALSLVARYPERWRGLILMDTKAGADTPEAATNRENLAHRVEESGDTSPVVDGMLPRLFSPTSLIQHADAISSVREQMFRTNPRAIVGALRGMAARPDRTIDLPRIGVPSLVLVGEDDAITPPSEAKTMAGAIPGARLEIIPQAGHLAPIENHAAVNQAILSFLKELDS